MTPVHLAAHVLSSVLTLVAVSDLAAAPAATGDRPVVGPGYDNTPFLPDSEWRVHDNRRPHPPVVDPGTASSQAQPGRPPADAVVLFDGTDLSQWLGPKNEAPKWQLVDGAMQAVKKAGSIQTRELFGSCQLHVEWAAPKPPTGDSQGRGNSGVFLMGRYEIQVLDSYDNPTYADGQAASLYGQKPPDVNACRQPGEWQSYDIVFEAPVFAGDKVVKPAFVTVFHNGVLVHHHIELLGASTHKKVPQYRPHPPKGPIQLQDHGNPVRYRNIWIRPLD
jgi:hypothetical protein